MNYFELLMLLNWKFNDIAQQKRHGLLFAPGANLPPMATSDASRPFAAGPSSGIPERAGVSSGRRSPRMRA